VYSIHTALDVIEGGTSDGLADLIELQNKKPIEIVPSGRIGNSKIVVFVPEKPEILSSISRTIFQSGGGVIGNYTGCSFISFGHGTFIGGENSNPSVGKKNQLEVVQECRMEVIAPNDKLSSIVKAIKQVHPYEEPAIDVYPLTSISEHETGLGRIGVLPRELSLSQVLSKIKSRTKLNHLWVTDSGKTKLLRAAVCPGAGGKCLESLGGKIDLFVTGEIRHHTALWAKENNISVICLGHGNSERITLKPLAAMLMKNITIEILISQNDRDPQMML
jgi:putative NIF3 family GTP cyclohydrolase 1 type 2